VTEQLSPEVELGVARENLSRAHALGTDDDIKNASVAVESAKQRVGREVAARHADLIRRSTLSTLGEPVPTWLPALVDEVEQFTIVSQRSNGAWRWRCLRCRKKGGPHSSAQHARDAVTGHYIGAHWVPSSATKAGR
jgi:hypothetical protein